MRFTDSLTCIHACRTDKYLVCGHQVSKEAYENTLARERGYNVVMVSIQDLVVLAGSPLPVDAKVTCFVTNFSNVKAPAKNAPIAYSYIDVFLGNIQGGGRKKKFGHHPTKL